MKARAKRKRSGALPDEQEHRYHATFDYAPVGIAHLTPDGRWLDLNDRLCAFLGYTCEELLACTWQDLTYADDLAVDQEYARQLNSGERDYYQMEKRYVRKDGTLVWAQLSVTLMRDAAGAPDYAIAVVEDIGARHQAEAALRASEQQFQLLADNIPHLAWMINETSESLWFNRGWYDYTGATWEEMQGRGWTRVIHSEDVARLEAHMRPDTRGEPPGWWEETVPLRGKDGVDRWFLIRAAPLHDGDLTRWFGACTDIEEQRHTQEALVAANAALHRANEIAEARAHELGLISDTLTDMVTLLGPAGEIVRTNPACYRLLQIEDSPQWQAAFVRASVAERNLLMRSADLNGQPLSAEAWPATRLLGGETLIGPTAVEARITGLAGRERVVSVSGVPLRDAQGHVYGALEMLHDITDRFEREQERARMLGVVIHELNTPVTALKLTTQVLQRRAAQGAPLMPAMLETMADSVARIERLMHDLIDATRDGASQLEIHRAPTNLTALGAQVASEQMAATGREILLDLPETSVMAEVDAVRIGQVLSNLLSNAHKYTPADAVVTLQLREVSEQRKDSATAPGPARAILTVRDTGPGIPSEALPRLFERFYRAPGVRVLHGSGMGLGVGLYLSKQLVEQHGGTIAVESELGHGAVFRVELPSAGATDESSTP
jgi:PAS domain S-box-containing protein